MDSVEQEYAEVYKLLEGHRKMALVQRAGGTFREPMVSIGSAAGLIVNLRFDIQDLTDELKREHDSYVELSNKYEKLLAASEDRSERSLGSDLAVEADSVLGLPSHLEQVREWLEDDNHDFVIPGGEWGYDLYCALRIMLYESIRAYNKENRVESEGVS